MKNGFRRMAMMACVIAGFAASAQPAAARAHKTHHVQHHHAVKSEMVRLSQVRLAHLGYFAETADGVLGPATQSALKGFQSSNQLPASGKLTTETYDLLAVTDFKQSHSETLSLAQQNANLALLHEWHLVGSEKIPLRYGEMTVDEEMKDYVYRSTVTLNGQVFIHEDNQPGAMQFSQVFQLKNEDALVITAYRGEENCAFKNYLVIINSNGTSASKRIFDSCSASNEVHQAFNALFVRFSGTMNPNGYDGWDVWRYEDQKLMRM